MASANFRNVQSTLPLTVTPLLLAIENTQLRSTETLLSYGADPNLHELDNPRIPPALFLAITKAFENVKPTACNDLLPNPQALEITETLLLNGADPNFTYPPHGTPLSQTLNQGPSATGSILLLQLLKAGADITRPMSSGIFPMEHAACMHHTESFQLILDHGSGMFFMPPDLIHQGYPTNTGVYALVCAVNGNMPQMVEKVIVECEGRMWTDQAVRDLVEGIVGFAVEKKYVRCLERMLFVEAGERWERELRRARSEVVSKMLADMWFLECAGLEAVSVVMRWVGEMWRRR